MKEFEFAFEKVKDLPDKTYKKGSKFDLILNEFEKQPVNVESVKITAKEYADKAQYLCNRLNQRIKLRTGKDGKPKYYAQAINGECYLRRVK